MGNSKKKGILPWSQAQFLVLASHHVAFVKCWAQNPFLVVRVILSTGAQGPSHPQKRKQALFTRDT